MFTINILVHILTVVNNIHVYVSLYTQHAMGLYYE